MLLLRGQICEKGTLIVERKDLIFLTCGEPTRFYISATGKDKMVWSK